MILQTDTVVEEEYKVVIPGGKVILCKTFKEAVAAREYWASIGWTTPVKKVVRTISTTNLWPDNPSFLGNIT